jgi:hypothetical protein
VDVIKFNAGNTATGGRSISLIGAEAALNGAAAATLVCKNKKKLMGFSKESYELGDLLRVQKGELPDPDGANK